MGYELQDGGDNEREDASSGQGVQRPTAGGHNFAPQQRPPQTLSPRLRNPPSTRGII